MLWMGTNPNQPEVAAMLDAHDIGLLSQPTTHRPRPGWIWAADNGCFTTRGSWREDRWLSWLERDHPRSGCVFAAVPDVVGDHQATLERWKRYADRVRTARYPTAFVAQDGASVGNVPWDEVDALFIGGTTSFKQGPAAEHLSREARERGKWVHVGRVNSLRRLLHWHGLADSSDGTLLVFGPEKNAARVAKWLRALERGEQQRLKIEGLV